MKQKTPTHNARTPITFDVDDPAQFFSDLKILRGAVSMLNGVVVAMERSDEEDGAGAFYGASELTDHLCGFVKLDDMDRLYEAAKEAFDRQFKQSVQAYRAAQAAPVVKPKRARAKRR
ncbi:MAG: hypothetical protein NT151_11860 [Acidobacteria bacterium]|nr:hypothetical protein [Acidobacteriota bacterium]